MRGVRLSASRTRRISIMSMPMETITTETELGRAGFKWLEMVEGVRALICAPLYEEGFANAFSTRVGGVSPFPENSLNLAGSDDARAGLAARCQDRRLRAHTPRRRAHGRVRGCARGLARDARRDS